jgi:hypothetical protein
MTIQDFNSTLDRWVQQLDHYTFDQLIKKPSSTNWSLGQTYMHLLDDTNWYIEQIRSCVSNNDNQDLVPTAQGQMMLRNNDFPNAMLKGASDHAQMPQPESKECLLEDLMKLKTAMNELAIIIPHTIFKGKTRHPGFGYFSAPEWLQLAEMHLRHHLRQKKRIDAFLEMNEVDKFK